MRGRVGVENQSQTFFFYFDLFVCIPYFAAFDEGRTLKLPTMKTTVKDFIESALSSNYARVVDGMRPGLSVYPASRLVTVEDFETRTALVDEVKALYPAAKVAHSGTRGWWVSFAV